MGFHIVNYFTHIIKDWQTKYDINFLYLIRHPLPVYDSLNKRVIEERELARFPTWFVEWFLSTDQYTFLLDAYNLFPGKVIIAEDLQENPSKLFKETFEYFGLSFKEEVLTFEPLEKVGLPKEWEMFKNWYVECFQSSNFKSGITDREKIVIEDESAKEKIRKQEVIYGKFVEERKKQLK